MDGVAVARSVSLQWLVRAFRGAACDSVWEKRGQIGDWWWWPDRLVR